LVHIFPFRLSLEAGERNCLANWSVCHPAHFLRLTRQVLPIAKLFFVYYKNLIFGIFLIPGCLVVGGTIPRPAPWVSNWPIAQEVGLSRNTVRRYLGDGVAERYRPRPRRSGKLAAFDDYIAK
jgi:hypothetical protein